MVRIFTYTLILLCIFMVSTSRMLLAQDVKNRYDRSALTVIFTQYGSDHERGFRNALQEGDAFIPERFFDNKTRIVRLSGTQKSNAAKTQALDAYFLEVNQGNKIVAQWFGFDPARGFDLKTIFERAEYNATDEEILVSEASKRGKARIRDFGQQLVQNSYVLVIDMYQINKEIQENENDPYGWSGNFNYYLYKLQFGEEEISKLYNLWVYPDDADSLKKQKIKAFQERSFPLNHVETKKWLSASGMNYFAALDNEVSYNELFRKLLQNSVDKALDDIAINLPKFQVQAKMSSSRPLKAKIGKKESLKTDHRYFVYEYVWDEKQEEALPKRKAVVRAKSVVDNRHKARGLSDESSFYQVYGGTIREGMTLVEKRDLGLSVLGGYSLQGMEDFTLRGFYRTGPFTGVPSFYLIGDLAFDTEKYTFQNNGRLKDDYEFFSYKAGLGKGWRMFRIMELMPYVLYGRETVEIENTEYATDLLKGGLYGGLHLLHNIAVYGEVSYTMILGKGLEKNGEVFDAMNNDWGELFLDEENKGREGDMSVEVGLRIDF